MFNLTYTKNPSYQLGFVSYAPAERSLLENILGTDYLFTRTSIHQEHFKLDETESQYTLTAELPGYSSKELSVEVKENLLTVLAENKARGQTKREIELWNDVNADLITGKLENGILIITLPKLEKVKPKRIEIK